MKNSNTYVTVDLDVLAENFRAIREKAGAPVMAVIKADAYGHGAVPVARLLQEECAFFGVSSVAEALELHRAGLSKPILILGAIPVSAFARIIPLGIRPTIVCYEDAKALSDAAVALGQDAPFHLAVDTGMSRIGFQVTEESADICAQIAALPGIVPEGLFSHFATADCADLSRARAQAQLFADFDRMLQGRGLSVPIRHMDNSAGIMGFSDRYEMVRSGIVTYGLYPSDQVDTRQLPIKPALSWYSRVTMVKTLPAGRQIGYGGTYETTKPTRVATVSVGYADGYRRCLSGRFHVLICGKKAPILGRVCMDQIMVDVTQIPDAQAGDRVVLIGTDGAETITVEQIAEQAYSFNYEFVCGISRRVPRVYLKNGRKSEEVDYLQK